MTRSTLTNLIASIASLLLLSGALLLAPTASAYQLQDAGMNKVRWQRNSVRFELVTSSFLEDDETGTQEAITVWNESPADFEILPVAYDDERGKAEAPSALHDLGDTIDVDDSIVELVVIRIQNRRLNH